MSQHVELSEELVAAAERVAKVSGRSAVEQIEYWVRLGRAIEGALRPETVRKLESRGMQSLLSERPE